MTTQEIASRLVALCRAGKFTQAQEELYAEDCRSIEMEEMSEGPLGTVQGREALREKDRLFKDTYTEFYGATMSDPVVAGNFFAVALTLDAEWKEGGRSTMEEICVYEVRGGRIVAEQFFYAVLGGG